MWLRSTVAYLRTYTRVSTRAPFNACCAGVYCQCDFEDAFCFLAARPRWDYATESTLALLHVLELIYSLAQPLRLGSSACFEALPVPAPACVPPSFMRVKLVEEAGSSTHHFVGTRMLMLTGCHTVTHVYACGWNEST